LLFRHGVYPRVIPGIIGSVKIPVKMVVMIETGAGIKPVMITVINQVLTLLIDLMYNL